MPNDAIPQSSEARPTSSPAGNRDATVEFLAARGQSLRVGLSESGRLRSAGFQRHNLSLRCSLAPPGVSGNGGHVVVEFRRERFTDSADFVDYWVGWHGSCSHQFFGRANPRAFKPVVAANLGDLGGHFGVRDMGAVPSHEKIDSMHGG